MKKTNKRPTADRSKKSPKNNTIKNVIKQSVQPPPPKAIMPPENFSGTSTTKNK